MRATISSLARASLILFLFLVACGDDGTLPPAEEGPIHTDSGEAVSKTVGPDGGSLITTASNGVAYTLEVPEGALIKATKITMTPILSIKGLGLSGGLAGAVELLPSGLKFAEPAVLRIVTTKMPGTGERLAGFSSNRDFSQRTLSFAASDGDEVDVLVSHFSAVGAGFGTSEDVSLFPTVGSGALESLIDQMEALAPVPWNDAASTQAIQLGHDAFSQVVLPDLQNAQTDADLIAAIAAYERWRIMLAAIDVNGELVLAMLNGGSPLLVIPNDFATEVDQALAEATNAVKNAMSANSFECESRESIQALANVLFWQTVARRLGVDTVPNALDRQSVLNSLCARVIVDSAQLPANLQVGFPHSLDLDFGLQFEGSSGSKDASFFVEVSSVGLEIQHPSGFSDSHGKYTTVVTATQDGGVSFFATAHLVLPGTQTASDVEGVASGGTGSVDVGGDWAGPESGTFEGDAPLEWALRVHLEQNQNAVTGTVTECHILPGGTISATLSGNQLLNVTVEIGGEGGTCVAHGSGTVSGNTMTITVDDPNCGGGLHWVMNLTKDAFVPCPQ